MSDLLPWLDRAAYVALFVLSFLHTLNAGAHASDGPEARADREARGVVLRPWWYWLAWGVAPMGWLVWRCA